MATQDYPAGGPSEREVAGTGWVAFAAAMLGLAGAWNLIEGLLAIGESRVYVGETVFVFGDLNTWGWIVTIMGVAELFAAFSVVTGSELGRWFGVGAAFVNSIVQLFFFAAYPWWAVAMFAVNMLVIYALVAYGGKRLRQG